MSLPVSLNIQTLTADMVSAVRATVSTRWPAMRAIAEVHMRTLAQAMLDIHKLHQDGAITQARAKQMLAVHSNTTQTVLRGIKGIGVFTAQATVDAALLTVAKAVNTAAGFRLLADGKEVKASFKAGKDL